MKIPKKLVPILKAASKEVPGIIILGATDTASNIAGAFKEKVVIVRRHIFGAPNYVKTVPFRRLWYDTNLLRKAVEGLDRKILLAVPEGGRIDVPFWLKDNGEIFGKLDALIIVGIKHPLLRQAVDEIAERYGLKKSIYTGVKNEDEFAVLRKVAPVKKKQKKKPVTKNKTN